MAEEREEEEAPTGPGAGRKTTPDPLPDTSGRALRQALQAAADRIERRTRQQPQASEVAVDRVLPGTPSPIPVSPQHGDTLSDKAVFGFCELLGLTFALPFGEDLYRDTPVTGTHIAYLIAGLVFAMIGPAWPSMRRKLPHDLTATIGRIGSDPRWWLGVLLLSFVMLIGPEVYQRAITVTPKSPTVSKADYDALNEKLTKAQGTLASDEDAIKDLRSQLEAAVRDRDQLKSQLATVMAQLQDARHQLESARQAARQPPPPPPPEDQTPIRWQTDFQLNWNSGANTPIIWVRFIGVSTALAHVREAYVISTLTGHTQALKVWFPNGQEQADIDQIEPIPSGANIYLINEWKPPLPLNDFLSQWGAFEFHVKYDNKEYVRVFDSDFINQKMNRDMSGVVGPRVTKKSGEK